MDEALKYIRKHLKKGYSKEEICSSFSSAGWSPDLIESAFNFHEAHLNKRYLIISIGLIVLIFCSSALVFFISGSLISPTGYAAYPMSCLVQDSSNPYFYHFVPSERTCCNLLIKSSCGGINNLNILDSSGKQLLFSANVRCEGSRNVLLNEYTVKRCTDPTYDNQDTLNL